MADDLIPSSSAAELNLGESTIDPLLDSEATLKKGRRREEEEQDEGGVRASGSRDPSVAD